MWGDQNIAGLAQSLAEISAAGAGSECIKYFQSLDQELVTWKVQNICKLKYYQLKIVSYRWDLLLIIELIAW